MPGVNLGGAQLQPEGTGDRPAWRQFRSSCSVDTAGALERRRVPRSSGIMIGMSRIMICTHPMKCLTRILCQHSDNSRALHHMQPVGISVQYTITRCQSFPDQLGYRYPVEQVLSPLTNNVESRKARSQVGEYGQDGVLTCDK